MQLAIVHQQHDRHRRELLGTRRQTEIGMRVNLSAGTQIGHAIATLEHDLSVFDDEHRGAGRAVRLELPKNVVNLFLMHWIFSRTDREGKETGCSQQESDLCALCESFASFAVKIFYRKVRQGSPQSSQRKLLATESFHVVFYDFKAEFPPPPSCAR